MTTNMIAAMLAALDDEPDDQVGLVLLALADALEESPFGVGQWPTYDWSNSTPSGRLARGLRLIGDRRPFMTGSLSVRGRRVWEWNIGARWVSSSCLSRLEFERLSGVPDYPYRRRYCTRAVAFLDCAEALAAE